jgi:hypothetical protein
MTTETTYGRSGARIALLLSFSAFFVFPAILRLGPTVGLAIPYVLAAILVAMWLPRLTVSDCRPFAWMMIPLMLSAAYALLAGNVRAPDVIPKVVLLYAMAFLVTMPTLHLLRAGYGEHLILGAALAIIVHAALGAYQLLAFDRGEFPFAELMMTNPSLALLAESPESYVAYVRRPFGLFAEPSAMAACVGPWLVVVSTALFTRPRDEGSGWNRAILAVALASGLGLVVVSQSGLAVPIAAGAAAPAVLAAFSAHRGVLTRAAALVISVAIVSATTAWLMNNAADRFRLAENESWRARLASLEVGARAVTTNDSFLLGAGPGQALRSRQARDRAPSEVTAVWSIALNYAIETGVLGLIAMLVLGASMARSIARSRAWFAGLACAGVWVAGVGLGTSYAQQPALWTAMAMLLSWRVVAEHASGRDTGWEEAVTGEDGAELAADVSRP